MRGNMIFFFKPKTKLNAATIGDLINSLSQTTSKIEKILKNSGGKIELEPSGQNLDRIQRVWLKRALKDLQKILVTFKEKL